MYTHTDRCHGWCTEGCTEHSGVSLAVLGWQAEEPRKAAEILRRQLDEEAQSSALALQMAECFAILLPHNSPLA